MSDATPKPSPRRRSATRRATGNRSSTSTPPDVAEDGSAIQADHVAVQLGAVGRVDAERIEVHRGAVGGVRASSVDVQQGALGGALAGRVSVRQSYARAVIAREVSLEQSAVRLVVAAEARIERASGIGVLIARRVSGDVRVLLDWRGALALGAAFGVVAGLLGRLRRR